MAPPIDDQVVGFFDALFEGLFGAPFSSEIAQPLKRRAVERQVQEAADAASQSATRFFHNLRLRPEAVEVILTGFERIREGLDPEKLANPNLLPEDLVEELLEDYPVPPELGAAEQAAAYRVALHSVVQVLLLVGPVMAEWRKLRFAETFELPRRVVNRLTEISQQLDALGRAGQEAADERYELTYRDYLLQRFHRVEAGTVRMTTNLAVDLRSLFVMPRVRAQPLPDKGQAVGGADAAKLMDLDVARRAYLGDSVFGVVQARKAEDQEGILALEQVKRFPRNVIVGLPGSGKSTFLEWLQLQVAAGEEEIVLAGQQAIPLLLRVRQLDPLSLPEGAGLIEKATASQDRAALMPAGWIERQMEAGRVFFMLDGLDETAPVLRDQHLLPWLLRLCRRYPGCRFLVSSRPVGYPPGILRRAKFAEYDLMDFDEAQVREYAVHWCTSVRLARNEPEEEAAEEGAKEGEGVVAGFQGNPYIRDLARNPLMLSAICLVNFFEGGKLPDDRALLYRLCVEGLLHNWDQRRGIHSPFSLTEKLRACREVALAMQARDRAEAGAAEVEETFAGTLQGRERAQHLLEHIRFRTGLLLERRPGIFAFAHLTFQEYLAACAVSEGNSLGIDSDRLMAEHADGRWREVIALYCGIAPKPAARATLEALIAQEDTVALGEVLTEAFRAAGPELGADRELRGRVLERVAIAPTSGPFPGPLGQFPMDEVAPIANRCLGSGDHHGISAAYKWLYVHPENLEFEQLLRRLMKIHEEDVTAQVTELVIILHVYAPEPILARLAQKPGIYRAPGTRGPTSQAEAALEALGVRYGGSDVPQISEATLEALLLTCFRVLAERPRFEPYSAWWHFAATFLNSSRAMGLPRSTASREELASLLRHVARHTRAGTAGMERDRGPEAFFRSWADELRRPPPHVPQPPPHPEADEP